MNALIFAAGSLLALFWALVSILANTFKKQDAPPQAIRPPPRRTARKEAASSPATPPIHLNQIRETVSDTVSLSSDSAGPSTSTGSDEREPPPVPDAVPDVPPSLPRSSSTASTSAHSVSASIALSKPRRTFSEFKVAFSQSFVRRRSSGGSVTDSEAIPPPPPPPSRRDRSRSSSRTRTQLKSIFTGMGRNRMTPSPASSEFPLTPSDSPLPLPAMDRPYKSLDETLMTSGQVSGKPGLPANLPSTATPKAVRRVSAPVASSSRLHSASPSTPSFGVHFVLPPAPAPRPGTGTSQESASSSLGLETNPVTSPTPPSQFDTSEPPRGRRAFWKPSFSRRTSIEVAQQSKSDKENASGTESEATSSRFKRGRRSLSLVQPSKVIVPLISTTPVDSPTTLTPSDTTPTTASSAGASSRKTTRRERRESQRSRSGERAPLKDRHARCAEVAHAAWGPTTTEPGKRPRTPRAGSSSSIISPPQAPLAHTTTSRPSKP